MTKAQSLCQEREQKNYTCQSSLVIIRPDLEGFWQSYYLWIMDSSSCSRGYEVKLRMQQVSETCLSSYRLLLSHQLICLFWLCEWSSSVCCAHLSCFRFGRKGVAWVVDACWCGIGLFHTNTFLFENASFSLHFGLLFTPTQHFCQEKQSFLKTLSKVDKFQIFYAIVWTVKMEGFENNNTCIVMWCILYQ